MPPTSTAAPRSTLQRPSSTTPSSSFLSTMAPCQERAKKDRPPQQGKTKDPHPRAVRSRLAARHARRGNRVSRHTSFPLELVNKHVQRRDRKGREEEIPMISQRALRALRSNVESF